MKKDTQALIGTLSSGPVRQYLTDHEHSDLREIILKNKVILGIPAPQLLDQIAARRKAKEKLPLYYQTPGIVYPPLENLEQSSSERTAELKCDLITARLDSSNAVGVDLTGGFGVDSFFLSRMIRRLHCVEPNESLLEIAGFNHKLLGASNITYHSTTAEEFIRTTAENFDFVYVDPSRRTDDKRRVTDFTDARPDVTRLLPDILDKAQWVLVKASPLLDIQAGMSQLPAVVSVIAVSVSNECKEVLFLCNKSYHGEPEVEATNLHTSGASDSFRFTFPEERAAEARFSVPLQYLYEPNAAILKAGAFKSVAARYGIGKLHSNTHLYTSEELIPGFPGRRFRVEAFVKPERSEIRKHLPEGRANVTTRNYPLTADELRKKAGLKDGGEKFLIGFSGLAKKYTIVATRV